MENHLQKLPPFSRRRLEDVPALREFFEAVLLTIDPKDDNSFLACEPHFRKLVSLAFMRRLWAAELAALSANPTGRSERSGETLLTLFVYRRLSLSVHLYTPAEDPEPRYLHSATEHHFIGVIGPGSLENRRFWQPSPLPSDILDRTKRLKDRGIEHLHPGDIALKRAGHDITLTGGRTEPVIVLGFNLQDVLPIRWRYDAETLCPDRAIAADLSASRLEFAAMILSRIGDKSSIRPLERLYDHPSHAVRWAALRRLIQVDIQAGLRLLDRAIHDPHPDVRESARRAAGALKDRLAVRAERVA